MSRLSPIRDLTLLAPTREQGRTEIKRMAMRQRKRASSRLKTGTVRFAAYEMLLKYIIK